MRKRNDPQASHANSDQSTAPESSTEEKPTTDLPYDDDPEWNVSFEKSIPALEKLAAKALKKHHEQRTVDLNPDELWNPS